MSRSRHFIASIISFSAPEVAATAFPVTHGLLVGTLPMTPRGYIVLRRSGAGSLSLSATTPTTMTFTSSLGGVRYTVFVF